MQTPACHLVTSQITHTRYGPPAHVLHRPGLSVLIDLDRLHVANQISAFFSVNRFNLFSFYERDFGINHKSHPNRTAETQSLAGYIRELASPYLEGRSIATIKLLAFPRILGIAFNPITIYQCYDAQNQPCFYVYEVHNTFGDAHSYISVIEADQPHILHRADKKLHVSPFFSLQGYYRLAVKQRGENITVLVNYAQDSKQLLTARLQGKIQKLQSISLLKALFIQGFWPLRPLLSIHVEALKLFIKKCQFYKRPPPPSQPATLANPMKNKKEHV